MCYPNMHILCVTLKAKYILKSFSVWVHLFQLCFFPGKISDIKKSVQFSIKRLY